MKKLVLAMFGMFLATSVMAQEAESIKFVVDTPEAAKADEQRMVEVVKMVPQVSRFSIEMIKQEIARIDNEIVELNARKEALQAKIVEVATALGITVK